MGIVWEAYQGVPLLGWNHPCRRIAREGFGRANVLHRCWEATFDTWGVTE